VIEYKRLVKLNRLVIFWTIGRIARGLQFIWDSKTSDLSKTFVAMILVSSMVVCELLPFLFTMDWDIISLLLLADEAPALRTSYHHDGSDYKLLADFEVRRQTSSEAPSPRLDTSNYHIQSDEIKFTAAKEDIRESSPFCVVQKAWYRGKPVFIKTFRFTGLSTEMVESLSEDLIRNSRIQHERLVKFVGLFQIRGCISRITEYCEGGSLHDVLKQCSRAIPRDTVLKLANGICEGVSFLHAQSPPIIHASLKTTNVLVGTDLNIKITDIGLRKIKACMELTSLQRSFTAFTAPEIFFSRPPTEASDAYSYGMICWEIMTRKPPYDNKSIQFLKDNVVRRKMQLEIPKEAENLPSEFVADMKACWEHNPKIRPRMADLKRNLDRLCEWDTPAISSATSPVSSIRFEEKSHLAVNSHRGEECKEAGRGGVVDTTMGLVRSFFFQSNSSSADYQSHGKSSDTRNQGSIS